MATQRHKPITLTPEQAALREQRMKIWRHNSFLGHCQMTRINMLNIAEAETATDEAKELAEDIAILADELCAMLEKRR